MALRRALVVGGSGFLGSAVCRAFIRHGWEVASLARNGRPSFVGKQEPAWSQKVDWISGSAFDNDLLDEIMPRMDCVVHTPGILFEQDYKSNGVQSLAKAIAGNLTGQWKARSASKNPLRVEKKSEEDVPIFVSEETGNMEKYDQETRHKRNETAQRKPKEEKTYECINVRTARSVLRGFLRSKPENSVLEYVHDPEAKSTLDITTTSPFVYISAEDIFRPFVPEEYITSKRRAEKEITDCAKYIEYKTKRPEDEEEGYNFRPGWDAQQSINDLTNTYPKRFIRPILVRPGLMYDYDERPITRLPSTLLGISASVQDMLPFPLRAQTIAKALSSTRRGSSPTMPAIPSAPTSIANLLSIPPMHVDVVAEAVVRAVGMPSYEGVLDTQAMAKMVLGRATGAPVVEGPQFV